MSPTYPLAPLAKAMRMDENHAARVLGIYGAYLERYREGMSMDKADEMAIRAGIHPYFVWPEMVDHVLALYETPADRAFRMLREYQSERMHA